MVYQPVNFPLTPLISLSVETVNPRKKDVPKGYLKAVVGATKRQVETKRVEEEAAAGSVEDDLVGVLKVCNIVNQ